VLSAVAYQQAIAILCTVTATCVPTLRQHDWAVSSSNATIEYTIMRFNLTGPKTTLNVKEYNYLSAMDL